MIILKEVLRSNRAIGLMEDPEFNKAYRHHDWRNYIPSELWGAWKEMSYEARVVSYLVAKNQADNENWD